MTTVKKTTKKVIAPKTDRRILRTRERLGDALIALMQERKFHDITVKNVLDRAGVSRSTFYVHYTDKDDLLLSDVEDFLQHVATALGRRGANSKRLLPVQEFLEHIRNARALYAAFVESDKIHDFRALGRGLFARSIEERMQLSDVRMDPMYRSAYAHALAGTFFSLLDWWIDRGMKTDTKEMDTLFHRLAWLGLKDQKTENQKAVSRFGDDRKNTRR